MRYAHRNLCRARAGHPRPRPLAPGAGDVSSCRMPVPSSILLLHGLGGSGAGSVRLLEERLRADGWSGQVFLRPTLQAVHLPTPGKPMERVFVQAWDEMHAFLGTRVPHLTVGFSFGGLLAAFAPSPLRLSVCAPWAALPADALQKANKPFEMMVYPPNRHGIGGAHYTHLQVDFIRRAFELK